MPVRLLTQSRLRWPEPAEVLAKVSQWADQQAEQHSGLLMVGVHGSYGRGEAGVGSDLDLVLIDAHAMANVLRRDCRWWIWRREQTDGSADGCDA